MKSSLVFLRENSISELYITGLFAEACIKGTAKGAIRNNYTAVIIEDAVGSKNKETGITFILRAKRGANIISTHQLPENTNSKRDVNHILITDLDKS